MSIDSILGTTSRKYAFSLWKGSDGKYYCKNGTGNGSTKDKCAGSLSMPDNDFILTAQWIERKKSTISFNANQNADNAGTSKQLPSWMAVRNIPVDNDEHYIGEQYTIPSVRPTADSSVVFMGWKIMKNGTDDTMKTLQPGDKYNWMPLPMSSSLNGIPSDRNIRNRMKYLRCMRECSR